MKKYAFNAIVTLGLASLGSAEAFAADSYTVKFFAGDSLVYDNEYTYGDWPYYNGNYEVYTDKYIFYIHDWEPSLGYVTGDEIYHAVMDSSLRYYSCRVEDGFGYWVLEDYYGYGTVPEITLRNLDKPATAESTYTFKGWGTYLYNGMYNRYVLVSEGIGSVQGVMLYKPIYESAPREYTIKFLDYNGAVISTAKYPYGTSASDIVVPDDPSRGLVDDVNYTFDRWLPYLRDVTHDQVYVATYNASNGLYSVTFVDDSGILQSGEYELYEWPEYDSKTPTREPLVNTAYTFEDWYDSDYGWGIYHVYDNVVYSPIFYSNTRYYWITFLDEDGTLLDSVQYGYNEWPTYYGNTKADTSNNYIFERYEKTSYIPTMERVTGNATYTVKYSYRVEFVMDDSLLQDAWYKKGEMPASCDYTPSKDRDAYYTYEFAGWDKDIESVTGPTTYKALFVATPEPASPLLNVPEGGVFVIDDFEDGDYVSETGMSWYTESDFWWYDSYVSKQVVNSDNGTKALKFEYTRYNSVYASISLSQSGAADLSQCNAIQYDYKGSRHDFRVEGLLGFSGYSKSLARSDDWTTVAFYWSEMGDAGERMVQLIQKHASYLVWDLLGETDTLEIDNVVCLNKPTFTVKFYNEDGNTLLDSVEFAQGEMPVYNGAALTEYANAKSDAQYKVSFKTWSPEPTAVTGNASYTAVYDSTLQTYCVEFYTGNGWVGCQYYEYGSVPEYHGVTPTADTNASCNQYAFDYWETENCSDNMGCQYYKGFRKVTGWQQIRAVFKCVDKKLFTITYKDNFGNILKEEEKEYDSYIEYFEPNKPSTEKYDYQFVSWDYAPGGYVYSSVTYTATFDSIARVYPIKFVDYDGVPIYLDGEIQWEYTYGTPFSEIRVPEDMVRKAEGNVEFTFAGWIPALNMDTVVTGEMTFVANYTPSNGTYTVVFMNGSTILQSEELNAGETPVYKGATPVKVGDAEFSYVWDEADGWDKAIEPVAGAVVYKAKFTPVLNTYEIVFSMDGKEVRKTYEYGAIITDAPNQCEGYTSDECSSGWYSYSDDYGSSYELRPVVGNMTYSGFAYYRITFVDSDGYEITHYDFSYGYDLNYSGILYDLQNFYYNQIVRPSSAQYDYSWNGKFDRELELVSGPATYTVLLDSTVRQYTVVFVNEDGSILKDSTTYDYGTSAEDIALPTVTPKKASSVSDDYTFAGWNVNDVTGNTVYVAKFNATPRQYKVTFVDSDSSVVREAEYAYGTKVAAIALPENMNKEGFRFVGWAPDMADVTGNATYVAQYVENDQFVVVWRNDDGSEIARQNYYLGELPEYEGMDLTKEKTDEYTFAFAGWTPAIELVTGDVEYTATYTSSKRSYTIKFVNYDDTPISAKYYEYGTAAADILPQETPVKPATETTEYVFVGWTPQVTDVVGKATYKAQFASAPRIYKVVFMDAGDYEWETHLYQYGQTMDWAWSDPTKYSDTCDYRFTGWEPDSAYDDENIVKEDRIYRPTYEAYNCIEQVWYTVTWVNDDGTVLEETQYVEGTWPEYNGAEPKKDSTDAYTYKFDGWSPYVSYVYGNAVYTAQFSETKRQYAVKFVDADGTPLKTLRYAYGTAASKLSPPNVPNDSTKDSIRVFVGWSPELAEVTGKATYTAQFNSTVRLYEVVFKTEEGDIVSQKSYTYGELVEVPLDTPSVASDECEYVFAGWNSNYVSDAVAENRVYTAKFDAVCPEKPQYMVTFMTEDSVLSVALYEDGKKIVMPKQNPKKASDDCNYEFIGWVSEATSEIVHEERVYIAQFSRVCPEIPKNTYVVSFVVENEIVAATPYEEGAALSFVPPVPSKASDDCDYVFAGWAPEYPSNIINENRVYTAQFSRVCREKKQYWVEFYDFYGILIARGQYLEGTPASEIQVPAVPDYVKGKCAYSFAQWDNVLTTVTGNMEYFAQYSNVCRESIDPQPGSATAFKFGFADNAITVVQSSPAMVHVQVFDLNGQQIASFNDQVVGSKSFSLESLEKGSYLVRVMSKSQNKTARIVVK